MHRLFHLPVAALLWAAGAALAAAPDSEDPIQALQAAYLRAVIPGERADAHGALVAAVLQRVQRSYHSEVDLAAFAASAAKVMAALPPGSGEPAEVFRKAMNEALATLDPYSRYLDPRARENDRNDSSGSFGGVGLQVEFSDGLVRVVAPVPGGPAAKAGVQAGDYLLRVDDQSLSGVPLSEVVTRLRGEPGTSVAVTLRRAAAGEITVAITRDTIRREVLRWNMEGEVLVLRLGSFTSNIATAVEAVAEASATSTPRGVVLDLRGNGGGLLREAVKVADAFLGDGEIVSLRSRAGANVRHWKADTEERLAGVPMVVLIDRRSASASELVAAALQDNGRAVVMGQRSFGKGTVQTTFPLGEKLGALKLTTSMYLGPTGDSVQKVGVMPDVELRVPAAARADDTPPGRTAKASVEQKRCEALKPVADPGLACAVAYLMAGGLEGFLAGLPGLPGVAGAVVAP